ncbi:MAG: 3-hydroxyanthranilic acid dioxygenase [Alectoria sarmentosa]|nr:MAG: 3-hydroxyanthranilic acid dioxygenase [Alectoria sarmentosa]
MPWNYFTGHCIDRVMWWNCVETMNILINATLIALPVWTVSKVQISLLKKVSVGLTFALRITVCIASICKLVYWNKARYSHDLTYEIWPVTICTQTIQCMSIASFCFLYLKPLFEILDSGFIRSDELRRKGQLNPEGSYNLSNINSRKERRKEGNRLASLVRPENNDTKNIALEEESEWDASELASTFTTQSPPQQIVGGPNDRRAYPINPTAEWFCEYKGSMLLKAIDPDPSGPTTSRDFLIREGGMFLLPPNTPHNPIHFTSTVGIVLEQSRPEDRLDRLRWYRQFCLEIVH